MPNNYYTPRDLAVEMEVSEVSARRALRDVARRLGVPHDANQHWRFDLSQLNQTQFVDAARQQLRRSAQHGLSRRSRGQQAAI